VLVLANAAQAHAPPPEASPVETGKRPAKVRKARRKDGDASP